MFRSWPERRTIGRREPAGRLPEPRNNPDNRLLGTEIKASKRNSYLASLKATPVHLGSFVHLAVRNCYSILRCYSLGVNIKRQIFSFL